MADDKNSPAEGKGFKVRVTDTDTVGKMQPFLPKGSNTALEQALYNSQSKLAAFDNPAAAKKDHHEKLKLYEDLKGKLTDPKDKIGMDGLIEWKQGHLKAIDDYEKLAAKFSGNSDKILADLRTDAEQIRTNAIREAVTLRRFEKEADITKLFDTTLREKGLHSAVSAMSHGFAPDQLQDRDRERAYTSLGEIAKQAVHNEHQLQALEAFAGNRKDLVIAGKTWKPGQDGTLRDLGQLPPGVDPAVQRAKGNGTPELPEK